MVDFIRPQGLSDQRSFEQQLAARFPAIAAEVDDHERGLLHGEMAVLTRATCCAIENGCGDEVRAHFAFVDEMFSNAAPDLENAIYMSYLENVLIRLEDDRYRSARAQLPTKLEAALVEPEAHWQQLGKCQESQRQP